MSVAKKIAYNVFFNSGAKVVANVLALIGFGLVTRYLGKEGFGEYAVILAFFALFSSLGDFGISATATREISREQADEKKILSRALGLRLLVSLGIAALAPLVAYLLPYSDQVKIGIVVAGAAFIFSSTYSLFNGLFQKHLAAYKVTGAETIGKAIQVALIFTFIHLDLGFYGILATFAAAPVINSILVILLSRSYLRFGPVLDRSWSRQFMAEAMPLGITAAITFFYFKMDTVILSLMQPNAAVGVYNAAYKIIENLSFFPGMIMGLIFPLFSRYILTDRAKFETIANKTFKLLLVLVVPMLIGTVFLSRPIMLIMGGNEFLPSAEVLSIVIFSLGFMFFGSFFNSILIASNRQKALMWNLALCAIFNVTSNWLLIPRLSYMAPAYITVATEALVVILTLVMTVRYLNYKPALDGFFRIFVSGAAMTIFLWIFGQASFFLVAPSAAIIYFVALWATRAVDNSELRLIFARRDLKDEVVPLP